MTLTASRLAQPRGILNPNAAETKFQIARYAPADDLACFVLRCWIIRWDLRGQPPYTQEVLTYPCANLVIEAGKSAVYGVETRKSSHTLEGSGTVFGVKFTPGGLYPFWKRPLSALTDKAASLHEVFGADAAALEAEVLPLNDDLEMIERVEAWLRGYMPAPDANAALVSDIVDAINSDQTITRVDQAACRFHLGRRTLERLFSQYVGVSPKWVIRRARLHEAADRLTNSDQVDLPSMALDLGYFDQAHFIKDFKTIIGTTPGEYARNAGMA